MRFQFGSSVFRGAPLIFSGSVLNVISHLKNMPPRRSRFAVRGSAPVEINRLGQALHVARDNFQRHGLNSWPLSTMGGILQSFHRTLLDSMTIFRDVVKKLAKLWLVETLI